MFQSSNLHAVPRIACHMDSTYMIVLMFPLRKTTYRCTRSIQGNTAYSLAGDALQWNSRPHAWQYVRQAD